MKSKIQLLLLVLSAVALSACAPGRPDFSDIPEVDVEFDCDTSNPLAVPTNPAERGPWPVGVRTVEIPDGKGNDLVTEIWYPATPGSQAGKSREVYDLRYTLPPADAARIPDGSPLVQECDCYRGLPIDSVHGQYPVILYIHGTAAFRTASLTQATHWASRGFVVVNADNPNIQLKDVKANFFAVASATQAQDTVEILEALHDLPSDMAFLSGNIDLRRVGVSGHSAGGNAAGLFANAPGVRTIIPMAAGGVSDGTYLNSSMIIAANADGVVNYSQSTGGYSSTPAPKRFVGIDNAGHLAFTELCFIGREFGGVIPLVQSYGIDVPSFFLSLGTDGCGDSFTSAEAGWEAINFASTAAFEETLQCSSTAAEQLNNIGDLDVVVDFNQNLN